MGGWLNNIKRGGKLYIYCSSGGGGGWLRMSIYNTSEVGKEKQTPVEPGRVLDASTTWRDSIFITNTYIHIYI